MSIVRPQGKQMGEATYGVPVVHFEITGGQGNQLEKFYGERGWKINSNNPMKYGVVDTGCGDGINGYRCTPRSTTCRQRWIKWRSSATRRSCANRSPGWP